ncbi:MULTISPECIES: hypothetical protein [Streptomyces]|uniref:Uncharacterized protein n=1 Tax=Streptomyces fradiae ATCC 10745 = DSM 40063 TaxID=1319510 RepID=A0A1Y2P253_STRFR|nr:MULTISPECIES: hypothetical protein [Streptomyces]KAF0646605.1 hypothetical protein K701_28050 [Streptomyces fradiae ATCC 10745 = DSM 40063]OSY53258.1 hypothetical protein BG846_01074 [Streptomyces fradiae ATCC 10745 = DSM 40063]
MKITVTVEQATPEFQDRLLALLAEHAAHVQIDATWTKERAERLYLALPTRARRIIKEAAANGGYVSANDLRDDENSSLRGHIAPIKRAIERGVASGWWPAGMETVVIPQGPGFGKVLGYQIPEHLVEVFKHAADKPSQDW